MSKHNHRHMAEPQARSAEVNPVNVNPPPKTQPPERPPAAVRKPRKIEEHRRCPICWEGRGGYGVCPNSDGQTRYYRCCKVDPERPDGFPCGFTWKVIVKTEIVAVETRPVIIEGQR